MRVRSIRLEDFPEGQIYDPVLTAQSGIFTPQDVPFARDGVAAECTPSLETLVVRDVDIELLRRHRLRGTVQNWNDRRRDLHRVVFGSGGEGALET